MMHVLTSALAAIALLTVHAGVAQTTGPSQPEVQSFQQVSIANMVEPSTGEFQYNISLFTIGGYPVNINYNSRVGMEQEASMVGLGFNLNCGVITRQVRGLPDDFLQDAVKKLVNMKENITTGIDLGFAFEVVGYNKKKKNNKTGDSAKGGVNIGLSLNASAGIFYNNYTGYGINSKVAAGLHGGIGGLSGNAGIGVNSNSQHGTSVNPYCGLSMAYRKKDKSEKGTDWKKSEQATKVKSAKMKLQSGGSVGFDFNSTAYSPKIDMPFTTLTLDFSVKAGFAGAYTEIAADVHGYRIRQKLQTNSITNPAYGFLYAHLGKYDETALMDFNRENDGMMTEQKPNLPLVYATPDVYAVAGQGVGGEFELKRNNVFVAFDPKSSTNSHTGGLEIEAGFGTGAHVGADLRYGYVLNTSEKWNGGENRFLNMADFARVANSNGTAEEVYFKNPNDVMFNRNPVYESSGPQPIAAALRNTPYFGGGTKSGEMRVGGDMVSGLTSLNFANPNRDKRLDVIYYLTANEAAAMGIEKKLYSYQMENFGPAAAQEIPRQGGTRAGHHLSEMICLKPDGSRYVFNVPAYNNEKRDVSYSINEANDAQNYLANFEPDVSTPTNENKGKDEFVSVTETPAYAHSFLLGSVLSANYIDVDDNGPSVNDLGDYVKFNYTRLYENYYWRSNNRLDTGTADLGNLADPKDGKAFYTEGKKEVWYIHSIESKNEVARFYYTSRTDAYDLKNTSQKLQRLDSILVFSRPELNQPSPMPVKRIYFEYNNGAALCSGVNNITAKHKLTLTAVYFKEGGSHKGKRSAYRFAYTATNPDYNTQAVDRWGNYKPDDNTGAGMVLDNKYFPFSVQDSAKAAEHAQAWLLKKITLPSGGAISINYEAHDYAFVQNKRAMTMIAVEGITKNLPSFTSEFSNVLYNGTTPNNYIIFKLKRKIPGTMRAADAHFKVNTDYFTDNLDHTYGNMINNSYGNLYGKFRVSLQPGKGFYDEDIPAFLNVNNCGALKLNGSNDYNYGFVQLRSTFTKKKNTLDANQVFKTAAQFVMHNYPPIMFGMDADPSMSASEDWKLIASMFNPAANVVKTIMRTSPYKQLQDENVARTITLNQSYIRVYEPDGIKYGGNGARVKSIDISDNWDAMAGVPASSASYTIAYDYRKMVNGRLISSGVASYEPEIGGEENPWKQPVLYKEKNTLMPEDNNFLMTPFGESLFPSAGIIYSEVKTTQNPVTAPVTQAGTGYTLNKYYTYYDFPCKTAQTKIDLVRKPKFGFSPLKNIAFDYMVSTQGYTVITNDMHGKPKAEESFGEAGNLVNGKYYYYKTKDNELFNEVTAVDKTGAVHGNRLLGVETQTTADARLFHTESYSGDVHGNLEFQMVAAVPTIVPSVWPDFAFEKKSFSSVSITKHLRQQGILDSVVAVDKGATVYTKNELWDAETGAVLLTRTHNEFNDPLYSFTYPAHWAYSGMGMASENISAVVTAGVAGLPVGFISTLETGDVLGVSGKRYVVRSKSPLNITGLYSNTGTFTLPAGANVRIIKSGKTNLATTSIGHITSLANPVRNGRLFIDAATGVTDASAVEYTNLALEKCTVCNIPPQDTSKLCTKVFIRCNLVADKCDTIRQLCIRQGNQMIVPVCNCDTVMIVCRLDRSNPQGNIEVKQPNTKALRCDTVIVQKNTATAQSTSPTQAPSYLLTSLEQLAPWQKFADYKFVGNRNQSAATPNLRRDGFITQFAPFWQNGVWAKTNHPAWQFTNKVSIISSSLDPAEWINPLNIYTSSQPSNFDGLVHATAGNARYHETLFDNFEDTRQPCEQQHYAVADDVSLITNQEAHSGWYSMKTGATPFTKIFAPGSCPIVRLPNPNHPFTDICPDSVRNSCAKRLTLLPNKKYMLSAWVKEANASNTTLQYANAFIQVMALGNSTTCKASGLIIDGWQRIEQEFTTGNLPFPLVLNFSPNTYFDDVRIFPAAGNMKSYVYSYKDYSLMAILDENNFASFYEYDNQKQLKRVKKETEKGVVTIQEVSAASFKN